MSASRLPKQPAAPPRLNRIAIIGGLAFVAWVALISIAIGLLIIAPILASAIRYVLGSV